MRVIHVSCVAPPVIGGIGKVAMDEVVGLRSRGVDARLIAPEPRTEKPDPSADRSFVERAHSVFRYGNANILVGIRKTLTTADVIHLHYPFYGTAEPILLSASRLPPIVMTFHMDATAPNPAGLPFALHRALVQPLLLSGAKQILVSSFDYARHSSLRSWFASHPERVTELPFAIDHEFFSPGPKRPERFAVPADAPIIGFTGGLDRAHAFKGLPSLLEAFSTIDGQAHLLIAGDGDLRASFEERARQLGVDRRTHFLGRVDRETLRDMLRTADVFAFPSTNAAEAFGLAALEAESCGTPVIASDLPGVRTVVRQGENGVLIPPNDVAALSHALSTMLADPDRRRALGQRGRDGVLETYTWDRHLDGLMDVYKRLCASPS